VHDYIFTYSLTPLSFKQNRNKVVLTDKQAKVYTNSNNDPKGDWRTIPLTAQAGHATKDQFYEIQAPGGKIFTPPSGRCWGIAEATFKRYREEGRIYFGKDNNSQPNLIRYLSEVEGITPWTWWPHEEVGNTDESKKELYAILGKETGFQTPKPSRLLDRIVHISTNQDDNIFDYFAGSGTTGHAVINLNRVDKGCRKYTLVEQGEYFDTVTKPRIQKVVYSADWKDGKATAPHTGISHAFKVIKIESYEDTLNNLQLRRTKAQQDLLDTFPQSAQEDYLLRYLLDIESRGSLLSVEQFNQPFDCKLKVAVDSAGAYEERTIDLVETFNYLIGLRVKHIDMQRDKGFVSVTGWLPTGEKTLVLWRDVAQVDYETLNRLCDKLAINPADSEFEIVYINSDHNIPAVFTSLETEGGITKTLKIRQIEPEFLSRMFAVEGV
jgi:adenine-specific DNA-methyltransferase